ncbi:unnamed protein product, partial [Symbiodinium sp. CCMP2592]
MNNTTLPEAMVRALNHTLYIMTGQYLSDFLVPDEQRLQAKGAASVDGINLPPVAERRFLVSDEEAVQIRSMNLLCALGLRGFPLSECCHPMWNDYLRAVNQSSLKLSTLKLTLLVNSGRGPYHSGKNQFNIEKATADLLSKVSDGYLESLAEAVWRDGGCVGRCPTSVSPEAWMQARGIRTRLKEAKNKSWFGVRECFRTLDSSWTYLAESASHAQKLLAGLGAAEDALPLPPKRRRVGKKAAADRAPGAVEEAETLSAKKMFDLLRAKYKNTAEFASVLLQDRTLQHDMRIIVDVTGPLHEEYQRYLDVHQSGHTELLQSSAQRSLGSWFGTVMKTVGLLQSTSLIARLELTPGPVARRVLELTDPAVSEDVRVINRLFDLVVELAANRMWSQAHHGLLFPYVFAAAAVDDARERARATRLLRDLANAWLKLEDAVVAAPGGPCAELLQDLGTSTWQVTREIFIQGRSCDWNLANAELQALCSTLFGGPISTKDILESTFAYLRDTMRQCKNSVLAQFTQYCYVAASPYGRHRGGIPHFRPSKSDFALLHRAGFDDSEINSLNIWAPAKTPLSDEIPSRQRIGKIRPAGFHANRVAAAASAYTLIAAPNDFDRVDAAWAGCLLTRKSFFLHKPSGVFYLSFGFMKWAAQALRLDKVIRGSEEYLTVAEGEMQRSAPRWLSNHSVEADGPFLHVPVEIVPPACRPLLAPKGPLACRIAGQPGDALKAALLKGAFLDKQQVKAICVAREVPVEASANKGPMLRALLKACFPDESDDFIDRLLKKQAVNPGSAPAPDNEADQDELEMLIHMTAALDTSEAQHFEDMRKHAMEQLEASEEKKRVRQRIAKDREEPPPEARGPAPREAGVHTGPQRNPATQKTKAPQEFLALLPDVQALYFHWEPQNRK